MSVKIGKKYEFVIFFMYFCTKKRRKVTSLERIQQPIATELADFWNQFQDAMHHDNPLLQIALNHLLQKKGKMMRPTLTLLSAHLVGEINQTVMNAALALELLHTASLVHDDVVDESNRRRGQATVNALLDNKAAVLVGDYILSKGLHYAAQTKSTDVLDVVASVGQLLADGELLQLHNMDAETIDERSYYEVVRKKTASLFAACAQLGTLLAGGSEGDAERMRQFGQLVGTCFQLRDDIFDYGTSNDVGKPTGNDMREGKLTLPVIHVLNKTQDKAMTNIARRVRRGEVNQQEIDSLIAFTREKGGLDYAEWAMDEFRMMAAGLIDEGGQAEVVEALHLYVDYVAKRNL